MRGLTIFLGGLAAGAVAALLLAPEKGSVSREKLKDCLRRRGLLPTCELDLIIEEMRNEVQDNGSEPSDTPQEKTAE